MLLLGSPRCERLSEYELHANLDLPRAGGSIGTPHFRSRFPKRVGIGRAIAGLVELSAVNRLLRAIAYL
jgi:hypothetical protein